MMTLAVHFKFDRVADLATQQSLADGREVTDDAFVRIGVPGTKDCEGFRLVDLQIGRQDNRTNADDVGARVREIRPAGAREQDFQLRLAPAQNALPAWR